MACIIDRAEPGIDADVWFGADALAIAKKLVSAEAVAFQIVPSEVESDRSLILWPNPILPVVSRRKISARPAQNRNTQVLGRFHHVFAIAIGVRKRTAFFVDAAVDHSAQVLAEVAEQMGIDFADLAVDVNLD